MRTYSLTAKRRPAPAFCLPAFVAGLALAAASPAAAAAQQKVPALLDVMTTELHRAFTSLGKQGPGNPDSDKQLPPYFLSYSVSDASAVSIKAQFGGLVSSTANHMRQADVQVRLGEAKLDNTHGIHRG